MHIKRFCIYPSLLKSFSLIGSTFIIGSLGALPLPQAGAAGLEQLLLDNVAVPTRRPSTDDYSRAYLAPDHDVITASTTPISVRTTGSTLTPTSGSLETGLEAISKKDILKARSIRLGMAKGTLDRKILAWAIALSNQPGVPSAEIAKIANDLRDWPGQDAMRRNSESAMARENLNSSTIIAAFKNQKPASVTGAILLAKAYLTRGNTRQANKVIAPFWHKKKLSKATEKRILNQVGRALTRKDHRIRMHYMFYNDRTAAANRVASLAQQSSLAKARTAVSKRRKDAGKKLAAVAASSTRDPGYLFARIQYLRRAEHYETAGKLLAASPRNPAQLIDPDEWWVERRIISRAMIDRRNYQLAYKLAAEHSAESRVLRAEAEFHAGWYALRFLKNKARARKHFAKILKISGSPITQARGHYWLGRASNSIQARKHYKQAAQYRGTYYGQLAALKLGNRGFRIHHTRPTPSDRIRFKSRELVRAIERLERTKAAWRANAIYRHLAKTLNSPGEIALLGVKAERKRNYSLALQIGKIGYRRGFSVESIAWPLGAIPSTVKLGTTSKALAYSIARQESAFNVGAVSPAKARGLLQLLPSTARKMARKKGIKYSLKRLTRDGGYNATLGAAYLSEQLSNFNGSYILTFVGYNAGPRRVHQWIEKYGDPRGKNLDFVVDWVERIPYTETRNYVQRVMENMQVYKSRLGQGRLQIDKDLRKG